MKKILSCVLSGLIAFEGLFNIAFAEGIGKITLDSTEVKAGEIFDLPITIEENPGIAAMSLNLTYDASKLELLGVVDEQILGTSSFLSGKDLTLMPYTMNWDDLSTENNTGTGTVATLSFRAKESVCGETEVAVAVNQKSTYNVNLEDVQFKTFSGTVNILPNEDAPTISVDAVTANTGDTVKVPIRIRNNPGIAALSLDISYDNTKLKLLGTEDGKILGTSTFLSGNDLSLIPYTLNWDDLSTENNTGNGIVAVLTFEVLAETGTAEIAAFLNQKSTYNVDLNEVAFAVNNGSVAVNLTTTDTTASITTSTETTTSTTSSTETTASTTTTIETTTNSVVTTVSFPEGAAVVVNSVTANPSNTVKVPICIQNNPGIAALSLDISYDSTKLKLLGAEDGKILGTSTFVSGNDLSLIPYTLNWDDLSTENNTGNGIVAVLAFEVLAETGTAEVAVMINQKSTYNVDLEEIYFETVNGAVQIEKKPEILNNDMNDDGRISVADAVLLTRFLQQDSTLTDSQITGILKANPDVNKDGIITIVDLCVLLNTMTE